MKTLWLLMAPLVAGGFGAGWLMIHEQVAPAATHVSAHAIDLRRGGDIAAMSRARFAQLHPPPPPAPTIDAPPPIDIAVQFRQKLTAIERGSTGPIAWVVDPDAEMSRRPIHKGQIFQDGWIVAAIEDQEIVLRRRREIRRINVFDPPDAIIQ